MSLLIELSALIEDKSTTSFFYEYRFKNVNDKRARIRVPRSSVEDTKALRRMLLDAGAVASLTINDIKSASEAEPKRRIVYAARTGWEKGRKAFVLQHTVVGKSQQATNGVAPADRSDKTGVTRERGSPADWSATIGAIAGKSTVAMFSISAAFAAPLLRLMKEQSFGFFIFGKGGCGKTSATLAAASVIGIGDSDSLPNWNSTEAGLEPYLSMFNDCLFPIDDFSKLKAGGLKERVLRLEGLSYTILNGEGRRLSPQYVQSGHNAQRCRVVTLTSGEKAISEMTKAARYDRQGGSERRLIDVSACYDSHDTIFDREGDRKNERRLLESLIANCATQRGTAMPVFLRTLLKMNQRKLKLAIRRHQENFLGIVGRDTDDIIASDIARKMALIYAAGRLAIEQELLPWKKMELLDAITKVYFQSRSLLRHDTDLGNNSRSILREYLRSLPLRSKMKAADFETADGYRFQERGFHQCVVRVKAFNRIFVSDAQAEIEKEAMLADGRLLPIKVKSGATKRPMDQHDWPNGKRVRSYKIKWPKPVRSPVANGRKQIAESG